MTQGNKTEATSVLKLKQVRTSNIVSPISFFRYVSIKIDILEAFAGGLLTIA